MASGIFRRGADSSDEAAKIWFSGYYKCQKFPKKALFTFQRGVACSDGGLYPPSPPLAPPLTGSRSVFILNEKGILVPAAPVVPAPQCDCATFPSQETRVLAVFFTN